ncbi:MAG: ribbon-helix-helix domain-containing protein [Armatimonadetes bacterium]|nr:ribbon-helix-helix domain-containing protein [Armatimonadota bacterium]
MATKAYTITMPEEIMGIVDEMARREHRSRSEMLREMVRIVAARRLAKQGDVLGALGELLTPLREATADMTDEQFDALLDDSIREVRDAKDGAGHKRAPARRVAPKRSKRPPVAPSG